MLLQLGIGQSKKGCQLSDRSSLRVTFMNDCRLCVKINITLNLSASILQQTPESQQVFLLLSGVTVVSRTQCQKGGCPSPAPAADPRARLGALSGWWPERLFCLREWADLQRKRKDAQWHSTLWTVGMLLKLTACLYDVEKPFNQMSFLLNSLKAFSVTCPADRNNKDACPHRALFLDPVYGSNHMPLEFLPNGYLLIILTKAFSKFNTLFL